MGWLTGTAEVDAAVAQTDGLVTAVDATSSVLGPNDQTAWHGVYAGWQATKKEWAFDKAGSALPGSVYGQGILDQCASVQATCSLYSAKIKAQGGNAPITPVGPDGPTPSGGGSSSAVGYAGAITTVAVIGGLAYGVHTILRFLPGKRR